MRWLWLTAVLASLAWADDVSVDQLAKIKAEQDAAMKKVADQHGNRSLSEMDNAERKQLFNEQSAASNDVLQQNGVSAKDYTRASSKLGREDRALVDAQAQHLAEKKPAPAAAEKKEIPIDYGIPKDTKGKNRKSKAKSEEPPSRSKRHHRHDNGY